MWCTQLAENTGLKISQNLPSGHHRATLSGYIFATKACIDNLVKQQYLLPTCPHNMANLRPIKGWDRFSSLGHHSKFQRVLGLAFVTAATSLNRSQANFARCLAVSEAGTLYIHFRELLPSNGILPRAKFILRSSLAFSYISSVTARHASSGRQPNFAALNRGRHLYSSGLPSRWALAHTSS